MSLEQRVSELEKEMAAIKSQLDKQPEEMASKVIKKISETLREQSLEHSSIIHSVW